MIERRDVLPRSRFDFKMADSPKARDGHVKKSNKRNSSKSKAEAENIFKIKRSAAEEKDWRKVGPKI